MSYGVFGEGHSNEVHTKNMISVSLIKHFLIVYICVIRNFNKKRMLSMYCGCCLSIDHPTPPFTAGVSNYLLWHKILQQFHLVIFQRWLDDRIVFFGGWYSINGLTASLNRKHLGNENQQKLFLKDFVHSFLAYSCHCSLLCFKYCNRDVHEFSVPSMT